MNRYCRCKNCKIKRSHKKDYRKHFGKEYLNDSFVQDLIRLDDMWYKCLVERKQFIKEFGITPEEAHEIHQYDKYSGDQI